MNSRSAMKAFVFGSFLSVLFVFSGSAFAETVRVADSLPAGATVAQRFAAELKCDSASQDPNRHWCPVAAVGREAVVLPQLPATYLGLSVGLPTGAQVVQALLQNTDLAILTLAPTGARVTDLKASSPEDQKELAQVAASLGATLKGMTGTQPLVISAGLSGFLKSENEKPVNAFAPAAPNAPVRTYQAKLPSSLYQVSHPVYGKAYVVIEQTTTGTIVSLFPVVATKN